VIEPRFPKYQWGQRVRLYSIFTTMAHIQISQRAALLVKNGDAGEIVQVGSHTESNTPIYLVEFTERLVVGCLEEESCRSSERLAQWKQQFRRISHWGVPHPNDLDLKRIERALRARNVIATSCKGARGGWRISDRKPVLLTNIDADGGIIDVALLQYDLEQSVWQLYRKDHRNGTWEFHTPACGCLKF